MFIRDPWQLLTIIVPQCFDSAIFHGPICLTPVPGCPCRVGGMYRGTRAGRSPEWIMLTWSVLDESPLSFMLNAGKTYRPDRFHDPWKC